jgi:signal transduction histidine kinase
VTGTTVETVLPYSGMAVSELPTLDELGIQLGSQMWPPFGDERSAAGTNGPIRGVLAALRDSLADRLAEDLPVDTSADERQARLEAEYRALADRVVAAINRAQPDRRYHVTLEYLEDPRNRFTSEFWLFLADAARRISGDRELVFRSGRHSIPQAVARLARPFGIEGTYRAIARMTQLIAPNAVECAGTTPTSATLRWRGSEVVRQVPPEYAAAYTAVACQALRGGMAAIPSLVRGLPMAEITQPQCRTRGAPYCEWQVEWQPEEASSGKRTVAVAGAVSVAAIATAAVRLPGYRLAGMLAAAALPLVVARDRLRIRQLSNQRDESRRQLLEQRELSEAEYGIRAATHAEIQAKNLELQRRVAELTTLNEVGRAVSSTLDLDALLDASLTAVVEHGRYERALVMLHDPERGVLTGGRSVGGSAEEISAIGRYEVDLQREGSLLARIFSSDAPLLVTDVTTAGDQASREFAAGLGTTSFLGTPLVSKGRKLGVLAVDHGRGGRVPDEQDTSLLFTVGGLISSAIESAQLYREIERHNRELEERVRRRTEQLARAKEQADAARHQAEEARHQAEAANDAKGRFLSNVSHELRTPLTSVLGFAKIIGKRLDDAILPAVDVTDPRRRRDVNEVRDNISIIVAEGERLTAMINNVLDLAKIEAGHFEWQDQPVSIPELIHRSTNATASLFAAKELELRVDIEPELPVVRGDPDRLLQVLINLLSNAVKFTDSGWVAVSAGRNSDDVLISVTDTGVGIAPEDYDKVFEEFRQVGDTLTDKPHGTGLGLPISKEIVEHHGGRLWLESSAGQGSTFWLSIPLAPAGVAATEQSARVAGDGVTASG